MGNQINIMSDQYILAMVANNNPKAWSHIYDKYAPAMFGIICKLTNDSAFAEEIFAEAFLQLKVKRVFNNETYALFPSLIKHTHTFARQKLKERGIASAKNHIEENSLLNIIWSESITIMELAQKYNLTAEETYKKVRAEFLELRNKNKDQHPSYQHQDQIEQYAFNNNSNNKM